MEQLQIFARILAARTYFSIVKTDSLEMDSLVSSDSPPSLQLTSMLFIIPALMLLKKPHIDKDFKNYKITKKFQLLPQIHLYYCVFLHHEAGKIETDKLDPNAY